MTLGQLWSILRGRQTNFRWANASWTYYPNGDPAGIGNREKAMSKPILCLDFDGVIHSYLSGWKGADVIPDPPVPGMAAFLDKAVELFTVHIFSSRSHQSGGIEAMQAFIWDALAHHFDCPFAGDPRGLARVIAIRDALSYPLEKPAAMVSIDDRALCFTGNWNDFDPQRLLEFKPWNKLPSNSSTAAVSLNATLTRRIQTAWRLIFAPHRLRAGA